MFCGTVWVLVFGRGRRVKINKRMLPVAILFLLFSTTVSVKQLQNILNLSYSQIPIIANYFGHNSPRRGPRITTWHISRRPSGIFFADLSQLTFLSRNCIFLLQTALGDAVVVSKWFFFVTATSLLNVPFRLVDLSLLCRLAIHSNYPDTIFGPE